MHFPEIAHRATPTRPEVEPAAVEGVEILVNDGEKPPSIRWR
jgi:hypothetical protein